VNMECQRDKKVKRRVCACAYLNLMVVRSWSQLRGACECKGVKKGECVEEGRIDLKRCRLEGIK
jgi:hypothetical protein